MVRLRLMKQGGSSSAEIARALGTTPASVRSTCSRLGITGRANGTLTAEVSRYVVRVFADEAKRRKRTLSDLLPDLLSTIACDNLFSKIIGDDKAE